MSVCIITRKTNKGVTYHVRWSRGRDLPYVLLGTHRYDSVPRNGETNPALRRAEIMRELALDDLARSIDPRDRLLRNKHEGPRKTFAVWAEEYLDSRRDLTEPNPAGGRRDKGSLVTMRGHVRDHLNPVFGRKEPRQITEAAYEDFVRDLEDAEYMPGTIASICKKTLRLVLRYAGVSEADNPTNSKRVRLPSIVVKPIVFSAPWVYPTMREKLRSDEQREAWDVMEHGGLRAMEVVTLTCGQLDAVHDRLVGVQSKGNPPRVVQRFSWQPDWIPKRPGAQPTDRVFPTLKRQSMAGQMQRISEQIGLENMPTPGEVMTPKDLRALCATRLVDAMAQTGLTWSTICDRDGHTIQVLQRHYVGRNPPPHVAGPIAPAA